MAGITIVEVFCKLTNITHSCVYLSKLITTIVIGGTVEVSFLVYNMV